MHFKMSICHALKRMDFFLVKFASGMNNSFNFNDVQIKILVALFSDRLYAHAFKVSLNNPVYHYPIGGYDS